MYLLLKTSFKNRKNLIYLALSFVTLLGLTVANQLEMLTIGIVANAIDYTSTPVGSYLIKIKEKFLHGENQFLKIVTALMCVAIIKGIFLFFSRYVSRILCIKISRDLRQQYFNHIQQLSMNFFQKYNIGSLSTRLVNDSSQIAISINSWITNYLHTPFIVITTLSMCFYISWQLSFVIFLGVPLIICSIKVITKKVRKVTRIIQKNQEDFASVLIDFLAGIQTVKIFSMEKFIFGKYSEHNDKMEKLESKVSRYDLLTRPILHFVTTFSLVLILFVGLYILKMQLAELIVFCGLLHLFYEPIRKFAEENANVQKGVVAAERLFEILNIEPEIVDNISALPILSFNNSIVFNKVWFKYESKWILKDFTFTVNRGETVAIVGSTGSGKSTILQLIPRLYEVNEGSIIIDGRPICEYTQKSLRNLISYVPQKPFLFNDTIKSNIAYGQNLSDDAIYKAAQKAYAHEFIKDLPEGYESKIAEMGKNLSGGQQQRIAIARALAKNASIIILDEATSSLDTISEIKIKDSIENLHGEVTQIIVAHRLTTIESADKIIFIENGVKICEGTINQLIESCYQFREMWEASTLSQLH